MGNFLSNALRTAHEAINPFSHESMVSSGLQDIGAPIRDLLSGKYFKSLGNFGEGALKLPIQFGLGVHFAYPAVKFDRPEADQQGPIEEAADRFRSLATAAMSFSPAMYRRGIGQGILASIITDTVLGNTVPHAGRAVDWAIGMRPTPQELYDRFQSRITPLAESISKENPGADPDSVQQEATRRLLTNYPNYLDWVPKDN